MHAGNFPGMGGGGGGGGGGEIVYTQIFCRLLIYGHSSFTGTFAADLWGKNQVTTNYMRVFLKISNFKKILKLYDFNK